MMSIRDIIYGNTDEEYHDIYPDMFRWIETSWATSRTAIEIDVYSGDSRKIHRLETEGYSFMCHFENKQYHHRGNRVPCGTERCEFPLQLTVSAYQTRGA